MKTPKRVPTFKDTSELKKKKPPQKNQRRSNFLQVNIELTPKITKQREKIKLKNKKEREKMVRPVKKENC